MVVQLQQIFLILSTTPSLAIRSLTGFLFEMPETSLLIQDVPIASASFNRRAAMAPCG